MNLIDIHCHLDFPDFDSDPSTPLRASREEVIKRTLEAGMKCINIGADLETSKKSIELAEKYEGIFASVGIHPTDRNKEKFDKDVYRKLAENKKVVAIGECGIDMFRQPAEDFERQKKLFIEHIELAKELNRPLMIHCRNSHNEVLDILERYPEVRGNIHFFNGRWSHAERYLNIGYTLSFGGLITYIKDFDKTIYKLPLEKMMVETDAPFVAPVPYRGQRCEPLYVEYVAKRIAEIKGISFEEVANQTTKNAIEFFGLSA